MFASQCREQLLQRDQTSGLHPVGFHLACAFVRQLWGDTRIHQNILYIMFASVEWSPAHMKMDLEALIDWLCCEWLCWTDIFSEQKNNEFTVIPPFGLLMEVWKQQKHHRAHHRSQSPTDWTFESFFPPLLETWLISLKMQTILSCFIRFLSFADACRHQFSRLSSVRANFHVKWLLSPC